MEAGVPGDHDQDPGAGAGRDLTREDLGHRPPTLLSGEEEAGAETEIAAETGAGARAETRAWIGARTRVGAGAGVAGLDPTLVVAESRDQRRGKTPGRDLDLGDPGPDPRGGGGEHEGWLSLLLQFPGGLYHLGIFYVIFSLFPSIFPTQHTHQLIFIIICRV